MIVATGHSDRHVRGITDRIRECLHDFPNMTTSEEVSRDWALLDMGGDVLLHVMLPESRAFYSLEKLWSMSPKQDRKDDLNG